MRAEQYVGLNIRHHREQQGMTQEQLGQRIAAYFGKTWTRQAVSDGEKGGRSWNASELVALADLLGTTPMRLITPPLALQEIELPTRTISTKAIGDFGMTDKALGEALAVLAELRDAFSDLATSRDDALQAADALADRIGAAVTSSEASWCTDQEAAVAQARQNLKGTKS